MFKIFLKIFFFHFIILIFIRDAFSQNNIDFFLKNSEKYADVVVEKVLSADSFMLQSGEIIKLAGIKAEAFKKYRRLNDDSNGTGIFTPMKNISKEEIFYDPQEESIAEKAYYYVTELLSGKHVRLEFDILKKDSDHKTLAYVFLLDKNNTFVNAKILDQGFAHLSISPPNIKYSNELKKAYQQARKEQRGLQGGF